MKKLLNGPILFLFITAFGLVFATIYFTNSLSDSVGWWVWVVVGIVIILTIWLLIKNLVRRNITNKTKPTSISIPWLGTVLRWTLGLALIFLVIWFIWDNRFSFIPDRSSAEPQTKTECYTMVKSYYRRDRFEFTSNIKYRSVHLLYGTFEYYVEGGTLEGLDGYRQNIILNKADVPLVGTQYANMSLRCRDPKPVILLVNYYTMKREKCK